MAKSPVSLKFSQQEFNKTLRQYIQYSRRDIPVIVNTKAFYIARRATIETPKADKQKIREELRGGRLKNTTTARGKTKQVKYTLAQLLIVARRAAKGLSTKKRDIADDVKALVAGRLRSIAFLKAGWIPAIKKLEPLADKVAGAKAPRPNKSQSGTQYGKPKGNAFPARDNSSKAQARIVNDALPNTRTNSFLKKIIHAFHPPNREHALQYVEPALERAIQAEQASMQEYIEKKLKQSAEKAGIKTR